MKNPSGNKLEKLVFGMFDQMVEGADKYVTKQGSTWLIFTESKKWVIEFTNDKTLWFNYNLFQNELDLISKDCTEERDLIKSWFESRFLNKPKVEEAHHVDVMKFFDKKMENTIENGVKETHSDVDTLDRIIEYTIHNGVKDAVEDTIQEGVKDTKYIVLNLLESVEDTIENGVKLVDSSTQIDGSCVIEDVIKEGVKDIIDPFWVDPVRIKDAIQNGVKETKPSTSGSWTAIDDTIQNGVKEILEERTEETWFVDEVIETGVKEIKSDEGYMNHFKQQFRADQIIQNGVKETKENRLLRTVHVMNTIKNGVKHVEDGDWLDQDERIDDIIESGVKEIMPSTFESEEQKDHWKTNDEITESVKDVIENGVKETKEMKHNRNRYHGHFILKDNIPTYIPMVQVQDVIENGVKEVKTIETANATDVIDFIMDHDLMDMPEIIDSVIENGVKEVKEISNFDLTSEIFKVNANRAIKDGVKELKELPDKSGEFRGYGDYYHRQEDITKPHTEYVKEVIEDSYNHMGRVEGVIRNTDKDGI